MNKTPLEFLAMAGITPQKFCEDAIGNSAFVLAVKIVDGKFVKVFYDKYLDNCNHLTKTQIICRDGYDVLHFHGRNGWGVDFNSDVYEPVDDTMLEFELNKLQKSINNLYSRMEHKYFNLYLKSTRVFTYCFTPQVRMTIVNNDYERPERNFSDRVKLDYENSGSREAREQRKKEKFINYLYTVGSYRI